MICERCGSPSKYTFGGEVALHFSGLKGLDKPTVFVWPQLVVCLDCGFTDFTIPEDQLRVLREGVSRLRADADGDDSSISA